MGAGHHHQLSRLSSRPLIATLIAMLWLGEPAKPPLFAGIVLLVAGVVTLVFSKGGNITGWRKRELWIPLMGATVFALGNVIRRFGLSTTPLPVLEALVINQTAAFSALAGYGLIWRRSQVLSAPRRSYLFFSISGVLGAIALFNMFEALDRGPVAIVDPLVGTQSLFTILVAYFVLHDLERITLRLIVGAVTGGLGRQYHHRVRHGAQVNPYQRRKTRFPIRSSQVFSGSSANREGRSASWVSQDPAAISLSSWFGAHPAYPKAKM